MMVFYSTLRATSTKRLLGFCARKSMKIPPKTVDPLHRPHIKVTSSGKCGESQVAAGLRHTSLNIFKLVITRKMTVAFSMQMYFMGKCLFHKDFVLTSASLWKADDVFVCVCLYIKNKQQKNTFSFGKPILLFLFLRIWSMNKFYTYSIRSAIKQLQIALSWQQLSNLVS